MIKQSKSAFLLLLIGFFQVKTSAQTCVNPPSGLAHWWQAEGDAFDVMTGLNGTLVNGTSFTVGEIGQGFSFNGTSDFITNSTAGLTSILNSYTMEFWAYPTASRAQSSESTSGVSGNFGQRYAIFPDFGDTTAVGTGVSVGTDGISVFEHGPGYLPSLLVYDANVAGWTHIAVVYENRQPKLYVNGVFVRDGLTSQNSSYPSTCLGEDGTGYGYYSGLLDEVSIYDRSLSATEVQSIYDAGVAGKCPTLAPSLLVDVTNQVAVVGQTVGFYVSASGVPRLRYQWQKDGTSIPGATNSSYTILNVQTNHAGDYQVVITNSTGTVASSVATLTVNLVSCTPPASGLLGWWTAENSPLDQVGTNHGVLTGNATYGFGVSGRGFAFDGNGDYASIGSPTNLKVQNFTIEAWVKRSSATTVSFNGSNLGMIFAWGVGGYGLYIDGAGHPALSKLGINNVTLTEAAISDTNFHHLAVTKSGSAVVFFIDGVEYPVSAYDPGFTFTTGARIGAWDNAALNSFYGCIDELSIYDRALSSTEMQAIYGAAGSGKCVTPGAPAFLLEPTSRTVPLAATTTFTALATGGPLPTYQWRLAGSNIAGATNSGLTMSNLQPSKAGLYSVAVSNSIGFAISSNALLKVKVVNAFGNGLPLTNSAHSFPGNVTVQLQNLFANGLVFYTLDGSPPSFFSQQYTGAFVITQNSILRTIAYSADFYESAQSDPITISIPQAYPLIVTSGGGGTVAVNPVSGPYLSNSIVTLTATPNAGWAFLKWMGDVTGPNATTNITMSRAKSVQAVFGTSLFATAAGGGYVTMNPPGGVYPYATKVQLSAIPSNGNFFAIWGNAGSGNMNPLIYNVTNANSTISSLFSAVGGGQAALTVSPVGLGRVSVSPQANVYSIGSQVTITATPDAGQSFTGWSGDVSGVQNPLSLTLANSKLVFANFTKRPQIILLNPALIREEGVRLQIFGSAGDSYSLDSSGNMATWNSVANITNSFGTVIHVDSTTTNLPAKFYRATVLP